MGYCVGIFIIVSLPSHEKFIAQSTTLHLFLSLSLKCLPEMRTLTEYNLCPCIPMWLCKKKK